MAHLDFEAPLVELEERIAALKELTEAGAPEADEIDAQIDALQAQAEDVQRKLYADLDVWKKVQLSRHPDRPYLRDYLGLLFEDFLELHGDRNFRDDPAIISGFARFEGEIVAVIGHQKGRTAKDKAHRNFGMAHPEGYRKAIRIMGMAERAGRPVLTFIDTPGAYPGLGAEERGQAEAIGPLDRGDGRAAGPGHMHRHRRRRLGRRAGDRGCQSGAHVRVRHIQRDYPRGMCVDPLAGRDPGRGSRRATPTVGPRRKAAWGDRRSGARASAGSPSKARNRGGVSPSAPAPPSRRAPGPFWR